MPWYRATKRINGRFYDYWQRTYRVGKSVKTENKYIGPAAGHAASGIAVAPTRTPLRAGQFEIQVGRASEHKPRKPMSLRDLQRARRKILAADEFDADAFNLVEDELDYARTVRRDRQKIREAKRRTKGVNGCQRFPGAGVGEGQEVAGASSSKFGRVPPPE